MGSQDGAARSSAIKTMFNIKFTKCAIDDLRFFPSIEQKRIVAELESRLAVDAGRETDDRKRLRPDGPAEWAIRFGDVRVYYDVDDKSWTVKIEAVGKFFMKVIPSSKRRRVNALPKTACHRSRMPGQRRTAEDVSVVRDDFSEEIEVTRLNLPLMAMLNKRAKHGASLSLEEVKKRIDIV
jgi:mRNA-degrading endonuclease RelE of RelBE toxin-antitoxin system